MFKSSDKGENITLRKETTVDEELESTFITGVRKDIKRIGELEHNPEIHANTLHLSKIVKDLNINVRIFAWYKRRPDQINMLGWHQYPSELLKGFHEGSDEVMLALYKLN